MDLVISMGCQRQGLTLLLQAQAGEYALTAWTEGAESARAEMEVVCKPGKASPLHCRSDMSGISNWRAGQPGKLTLSLKDK